MNLSHCIFIHWNVPDSGTNWMTKRIPRNGWRLAGFIRFSVQLIPWFCRSVFPLSAYLREFLPYTIFPFLDVSLEKGFLSDVFLNRDFQRGAVPLTEVKEGSAPGVFSFKLIRLWFLRCILRRSFFDFGYYICLCCRLWSMWIKRNQTKDVYKSGRRGINRKKVHAGGQ